MSGFIEGEARTQATLFPDQLDEYVSEGQYFGFSHGLDPLPPFN